MCTFNNLHAPPRCYTNKIAKSMNHPASLALITLLLSLSLSLVPQMSSLLQQLSLLSDIFTLNSNVSYLSYPTKSCSTNQHRRSKVAFFIFCIFPKTIPLHLFIPNATFCKSTLPPTCKKPALLSLSQNPTRGTRSRHTCVCTITHNFTSAKHTPPTFHHTPSPTPISAAASS